MIAVASHTGWSLSEMLALPCEELVAWHETLREQVEAAGDER